MLRDEIETAKRTVSTDTVQMTIGEVAHLYGANELNILPDFQRLFRWSPSKKSNFVESILIGIPIPPAFVYENQDGTWELIDGLQRISTILEFMGILRDPDTAALKRSQLMTTKYLPSLDGIVWNSEKDDEKELDRPSQLFFRRHRIDFQILKHPSDPKTKFDLFQRLNRGGAYANEQEVRTCSMVLANGNFTQRLRDFTKEANFQTIFRVNEEQRKNQTDFEYAVRVVVHTYEEFVKGKDVQEFLDSSILTVMETHDVDEVIARVAWPVDTLHRLYGERALVPPGDAPADFAPRFSLRALEGIVVGLARNRDAILALENVDDFIKSRIRDFWAQPEVAEMSAPGLRGTVRIQRTVPFGARWFNPNA